MNETFPLISSRALVEQGESEPTEWLVEGLIPKGSLVMLAGPPGSYKTYFALLLARSIAEGERFLGRVVETASVVYLDRENPRSLLVDRLVQVGASDKLAIWPLWVDPEAPQLDTMRGSDYAGLAKERGLLVFDSFRRFHESEENSSSEMAPIMTELRRLTKSGTAVIVIHHSGKASLYRGSTEILAGFDIAFYLEKKSENGGCVQLELDCLKHRWVRESKTTLHFEVNGERAGFFDPQKKLLGELWGIMREYVEKSGTVPNQSQVVSEARRRTTSGKDTLLSFLKDGERKLWTAQPQGSGKPTLYQPVAIPRWLIP